jgi:hypothetical protein
LNITKFRHEGDSIYAFKPKTDNVFRNVRGGNNRFALHFPSDSTKTPVFYYGNMVIKNEHNNYYMMQADVTFDKISEIYSFQFRPQDEFTRFIPRVEFSGKFEKLSPKETETLKIHFIEFATQKKYNDFAEAF